MRRLMFFVGGALCGVLIGTTVALLLTPASGDTLREDAKSRFEEMMSEARLASEKRRIELEAQLAQLTGEPPRQTALKKA